ncbi:hypothetical protein [Sporolactobacillus laevolacticus]|uniref:Uncharacterized protein n=1 Tax=Sporolactobacillus laevolacticus DSM 442 TaxID=1395513 RepID=V6J3J7_9BACL|nr:hypothetical protein [Sporolactobacillus laevolacticus]EST11279.1 hypothetical protein P343_12815 [Sporolactobacillus laevolacticus DSM 442]
MAIKLKTKVDGEILAELNEAESDPVKFKNVFLLYISINKSYPELHVVKDWIGAIESGNKINNP